MDQNGDNVNSAVAVTKPSPAKKTAPVRTMPKWEAEARERLKVAIKKFSKPLADLAARDANEGDTRLLVTDFLCEGLGYDKFADLTTEYLVKGEFADYGVRIDKQLVAFIEVKRIATKLDSKHLRQVEMYALNEGVEWVILTNAADWFVYHLTPGLPVSVDLAMSVNLLNDDTISHKVDQLYHLTRESLKKRQIDELWKAKRATSPRSLVKVLTSHAILDEIRQELRRQTGHNVEVADIERVLKAAVIRPEWFDSNNAAGQTGQELPRKRATKVAATSTTDLAAPTVRRRRVNTGQ